MVKSIRILLAIAAYYNYKIWQMDVKTAFLNESLEEDMDVYMTHPKGFVDLKDAGNVCKLRRSIYGLKQASRRWNICFHETVKKSLTLFRMKMKLVFTRSLVGAMWHS